MGRREADGERGELIGIVSACHRAYGELSGNYHGHWESQDVCCLILGGENGPIAFGYTNDSRNIESSRLVRDERKH